MQDPPLKGYYDVLGVSPAASRDEVKRAWRDLCKVWHPDRFEGDLPLQQRAEEKLRAVNAAYEAVINIEPPGAQLTILEPPQSMVNELERQSAEVELGYAEKERLRVEALRPEEDRKHRLAVVVTSITFPIAFFFAKYTFESSKKILVKQGGFFSPAQYETVTYVDWPAVLLLTVICCVGNYSCARHHGMRDVLKSSVSMVLLLLFAKWVRTTL